MNSDNLSLRLELVSPQHLVYEGDVKMVMLPAIAGQMGILPRHAPLVAELVIGKLRVQTMEGKWLTFAVSDGFAKVQFNKVIVLVDSAEEAGTIDLDQARLALDEARKRLDMYHQGAVPEGEEVDPFKEQLALRRAQNRLKIAEMAK